MKHIDPCTGKPTGLIHKDLHDQIVKQLRAERDEMVTMFVWAMHLVNIHVATYVDWSPDGRDNLVRARALLARLKP